MEEISYLYRYSCLSYTEEYNPKLTLQSFPILRTTPCGFWIKYCTGYKPKKFILSGSGKRFAYDTVKGALVAFIYRKKREQKILTGCMERSKTQLLIAEIELSKISK
jgi:hypothetical protein